MRTRSTISDVQKRDIENARLTEVRENTGKNNRNNNRSFVKRITLRQLFEQLVWNNLNERGAKQYITGTIKVYLKTLAIT